MGTRAVFLLTVAVALPSAAALARAAGMEPGRPGRFVVDTNPYVLGQAVDWLDRTHVVWHDPVARDEDDDGETQIYRSTLDGGDKACLTCGLPGPNHYTETVDAAINPELFFCRLRHRARGPCRPVRLTQDPAWDEQATFTPDMERILFMSSRNLPGAFDDWARVAAFLALPADYDYVLILGVFSGSFLQPVFQQATDLYEIRLRWNRSRTRFRRGPVRRLTRSGEDGWVIPEFAWDPSGRRLLWTQNKFPDGVRVDQRCVMRRIRRDFISRLAGVQSIGQIPFGIDAEVRDEAARLLQDPRTYPRPQGDCGGNDPGAPVPFAQETRIGHYEQ